MDDQIGFFSYNPRHPQLINCCIPSFILCVKTTKDIRINYFITLPLPLLFGARTKSSTNELPNISTYYTNILTANITLLILVFYVHTAIIVRAMLLAGEEAEAKDLTIFVLSNLK